MISLKGPGLRLFAAVLAAVALVFGIYRRSGQRKARKRAVLTARARQAEHD